MLSKGFGKCVGGSSYPKFLLFLTNNFLISSVSYPCFVNDITANSVPEETMNILIAQWHDFIIINKAIFKATLYSAPSHPKNCVNAIFE